MRLHHFAHSSASYRVRIALALKGVPFDSVVVDMTAGEQQGEGYAAVNPQRLVPCLELPGGTVLGQSLAIIGYLDRVHPEPALWPSDPLDRAAVEAQCLMIACETAPIQAKIVQRWLAGDLGVDAEGVQRWLTRWIRRGLGPVNDYVAGLRTAYAGGAQPGMLDLMIVPQMRNADRFGVDVSDYQALRALEARCLAHPAFQAAHPDRWT